MDAAVAGLIGAAIGSGTSILTVWLQAIYLGRRERAKFVMEFASKDRQSAVDGARIAGKSAAVAPIALYAHYHSRLLKMIEQGNVSDAELEKLSAETDAIWNAVKAMQEKRQA
jgi:hypothetical protein